LKKKSILKNFISKDLIKNNFFLDDFLDILCV